MAKKKKSIELQSQNITFKLDNQLFHIIRFNLYNMTLDVIAQNDGVMKKGKNTLPFAHLPKEIKKLIKLN
jgi:hypothetical protein